MILAILVKGHTRNITVQLFVLFFLALAAICSAERKDFKNFGKNISIKLF